jgi:hypothetical protein
MTKNAKFSRRIETRERNLDLDLVLERMEKITFMCLIDVICIKSESEIICPTFELLVFRNSKHRNRLNHWLLGYAEATSNGLESKSGSS